MSDSKFDKPLFFWGNLLASNEDFFFFSSLFKLLKISGQEILEYC